MDKQTQVALNKKNKIQHTFSKEAPNLYSENPFVLDLEKEIIKVNP